MASPQTAHKIPPGKPRLVYFYPWQDRPATLSIHVDTDFAGCRVTRRSTSGGVARYGRHCLRHWSVTQPTLALSSGEAELGGLCKGGANAIGLRSVGNDLGLSYGLTLFPVATAAIGISRRLGIGKIKHLDTSLLRIQTRVRSKDIGLEKSMCLKIQATHLQNIFPPPQLKEHISRMGLLFETGRAESAPQIAN